ncbi:Fe-only hydrogenase, subunit beta [Melioribacter roseus P3M-2]|uniref:Fe-only hydrogenase, subunit beta n=1 Tax=Melioribacter roseus (strain DSM 23840 / JCM 17771 / VKM B-2668 / P3M-2) TaxID=1191523 RepID=I6ZXV7_MELRP|nr:NADH-quinone oxidoreductase subunit NuoF [Melioribacter roseus]AFN73878.1 Fe-only hydrogenase, subunit beta [Melioribacter roseus P3M-2]
MRKRFADLEEISLSYKESGRLIKRRVTICAGTGCVANGSLEVYNEFLKQLESSGIEHLIKIELKKESSDAVLVSSSGCQGFCQMGPLVTIEPDGIMYVQVGKDDVKNVVERTLMGNEVIEELLYTDLSSGKKCKGTEDINFYKRQKRFVLGNCGRINPEDIYEYIASDGYKAARRAILEMTDAQICQEILRSGLRGRGGGGFPTGKKWELTRQSVSDIKYVICNGDEGDPGAFMDRSIMEGNPHSVIEGMMIAAKAIGASKGYVYVRMEYPLAVKRLRIAVQQARELGLLGLNIFDSGFDFDIEIMEGAGAFVCGEETALMASIEGNRGMPNPKPPFPAESGLFGKPTLINNVETLSSVPKIILNGPDYFSSIGTDNSPGTKTFALTGNVVNTGLIEVPFGTTLREIIFEIGGGVVNDNGEIDPDAFKAVQIGGPSGGCLVEEHLDLPLDFDSLGKVGAMVGSGGLVVMNKSTCMVQMARFFMQFTQNESCGKCVLCREGTKQMLALLDDIMEGRATYETISLLEELAGAVNKGSLCGLGKTAPNPVLSTLHYFRDEYYAHVEQKRCPAKQCKALLTPVIIPELCKGCGVCLRKCPTGAITGSKKEPHVINEELCIKCMACLEACRLNAVTIGG